MSKYTEKPNRKDHIMTWESFFECCKDGMFIDYDGFGHPMKDGLIDPNVIIKPSTRNSMPTDATHIVWYNK